MMSLSFLEIWTYRVGVGSIITGLKISKAKGRYVFSWRGEGWEILVFLPKESVGPPSCFD